MAGAVGTNPFRLGYFFWRVRARSSADARGTPEYAHDRKDFCEGQVGCGPWLGCRRGGRDLRPGKPRRPGRYGGRRLDHRVDGFGDARRRLVASRLGLGLAPSVLGLAPPGGVGLAPPGRVGLAPSGRMGLGAWMGLGPWMGLAPWLAALVAGAEPERLLIIWFSGKHVSC